MQLLQTYQDIKAHRLIDSKLKLFETSVWLHAFSRSIISIFIPILMLNLGYGVKAVIIYYFLYTLFDVPLNFFADFVVRKIGARLAIIIASFFSIAFFVSLYYLTSDNWSLLVLMAIFAALYDTLYWVAHLYLFMVFSKNDDNVSKDISVLSILRQLAGILGPALGVAILIFFNQKILILASIIILVISIWPLFLFKNIKDKPVKRKKNFFEFFNQGDVIKDYISTSLFSVHRSAESVIWPIFIFLLFESVQSVAYLAIIIAATSMIFTYSIGHISKDKRTTMIVMGGLFIAIMWAARLIFENPIFYYASVFVVGFFSILISIPLDSNIFEKGEKRDTMSTSTYRNSATMFGKLVLFSILLILVNVFNVSFLTAAISLFLLILLNYFFIIKTKVLPQPKMIKM